MGLLWSEYQTRSHCLYDLKQTVERDSKLRKPYGCMYWGYQNPYVLYLINWYFAKDDLLCIIRYFGGMQNAVYEPLLKGNPNQGDGWYCYLYF